MSNHQVTTPLDAALSFVRNGIKCTMNVFEGKKGKWEGRKFQAPQVTTDGTDSDIANDSSFLDSIRLIGKENVANSMNAILKRYGQDFIIDATDETTGQFDLEKYINFWVNLTSAALSKAELEEAQQQLADELSKAALGVDYARAATDPVYKAEFQANIERISKQLASVKASLEQRKARRSKEENTETVMAAQ